MHFGKCQCMTFEKMSVTLVINVTDTNTRMSWQKCRWHWEKMSTSTHKISKRNQHLVQKIEQVLHMWKYSWKLVIFYNMYSELAQFFDIVRWHAFYFWSYRFIMSTSEKHHIKLEINDCFLDVFEIFLLTFGYVNDMAECQRVNNSMT